MLAYELPSASSEERASATREFREVVAERRRVALRAARAVVELARTGAHFFEGASSIAHFAEMNGMAAHEARELENLGHAIASDPSVAGEVERGAIPVASAAILGEVARTPGLVRRGDDWLGWARSTSTRELRRLFLRRRDEARAGEPVALVMAYVTRPVREDIDRARSLTSRKAHIRLTLGQTLGIVIGDWLAENDPLRAASGTRRLSDTSAIPDSRYVPAEVDRLVRARSGDACIVSFCDNETWLHRSHRHPHADGGSREASNLDLLCDFHHLLYETGLIRIEGPADAPLVTDRHGRPMDARMPLGVEPSGGAGRDPPSSPAECAPRAPPDTVAAPTPGSAHPDDTAATT